MGMPVATCDCGCGERPLRHRKWVKGHRPLKPMANGYRRVCSPGHPLADKYGMVLEHRKVAYDASLEVSPGHHVHHRNGDKLDNRVENLEVLPAGAHHRFHVRQQGFVINQYGIWPLRGGAA